jgi:hypothetical protein
VLAAIVSRQAMKGAALECSGPCGFVEPVASADGGDLQMECGVFRMAAGIEHRLIRLFARHDGHQNLIGSMGFAEMATKAALARVNCLHRTPPVMLVSLGLEAPYIGLLKEALKALNARHLDRSAAKWGDLLYFAFGLLLPVFLQTPSGPR